MDIRQQVEQRRIELGLTRNGLFEQVRKSGKLVKGLSSRNLHAFLKGEQAISHSALEVLLDYLGFELVLNGRSPELPPKLDEAEVQRSRQIRQRREIVEQCVEWELKFLRRVQSAIKSAPDSMLKQLPPIPTDDEVRARVEGYSPKDLQDRRHEFVGERPDTQMPMTTLTRFIRRY